MTEITNPSNLHSTRWLWPGGAAPLLLRPSEARYQSRWGTRRGFCRLALQAQVPMLLAAVPRADELYSVYASKWTDRIYKRLHLPIPLIRGLGPTLLPRPIALTAYLAPVLVPPPLADDPARPPPSPTRCRCADSSTSRLGGSSRRPTCS